MVLLPTHQCHSSYPNTCEVPLVHDTFPAGDTDFSIDSKAFTTRNMDTNTEDDMKEHRGSCLRTPRGTRNNPLAQSAPGITYQELEFGCHRPRREVIGTFFVVVGNRKYPSEFRPDAVYVIDALLPYKMRSSFLRSTASIFPGPTHKKKKISHYFSTVYKSGAPHQIAMCF